MRIFEQTERMRICAAVTVILCVLLDAGCSQENSAEGPGDGGSSDLAETFVTTIAGSHPDTWPKTFGFGRPADSDEIQAWDIDVRPDGKGLPPGSGTVDAGAIIYAEKCAACHGETGTEGPNNRLVGRVPGDEFRFGQDLSQLGDRTIGSYWPYATTVFDYIRRAMPQNMPGSLTADEVYSLTAFLLHENGIIPEDAEMNMETLPQVLMPSRDRFVRDDRRGGAEIR